MDKSKVDERIVAGKEAIPMSGPPGSVPIDDKTPGNDPPAEPGKHRQQGDEDLGQDSESKIDSQGMK